MTGDYNSVIGMAKDEPLQRFLRRISSGRFEAASGPATLCAIALETDPATGLAARVGRGAARRLPRAGAFPPSGLEFPAPRVFISSLRHPIRSSRTINSFPRRGRERATREEAMAGHSQFKNIMHRKGRQDAVKSKLFGKLAREITVSAKLGLPDPAMNPRLRAAIIAARAENMPKDNIERAIKKAAGGDAENYEEIRYEGYGPGGVAVIVEVLTDNRNRTAGEVRSTFTKSGGNLAETGAVSFMFDHVGVIEYDAKAASAEAMFEAALEAGADDVVSSETRPRGLRRAGAVRLGRQGAGSKNSASRARRRWSGGRRTPCDRRRAGREAAQADRELERARRRAERLCQFRDVRRAGAKDERVAVMPHPDFSGIPAVTIG